MANYYGNRLVKFISPQCDKMFFMELGGREEELKDLLATILNIPQNELKGIKDAHNNYYTFSSAIRNHNLTNTYSQYYTIVLSNAFNGYNQMKRSSSLNLNALSSNFNQVFDNKRKKTDNALQCNQQSFKQEQLLMQLEMNKLLNAKDIEKIQMKMKEEQNKDIIALLNNYNGYDLNILANKALDLINSKNDQEINNNNNSKCYQLSDSQIIQSIDIHFEDKHDIKLLKKLLSFDNEVIKNVFEEYQDNKNKIRLIDKLKQIVIKYKDKLNSNSESIPSSVSSRKQHQYNKDLNINNNYNSIVNKLSFDQRAVLEHSRYSFKNYYQLFELDKNFFHSNNENNSINLIKKYCNEFIQKNIFAYFTQEEIDKYNIIVNDVENNKDIIKAFEIFRTQGFNINELKTNIKGILQHIISQDNKNMMIKNNDLKQNLKNNDIIEADNKMNVNKDSPSYQKNFSLNHPKSQRYNENNKAIFNKKISSEKINEETLHKEYPESNKKLNEFIKVISSFPFEENSKSNLLKLVSEKDESMMKIFENYKKNKMSLTKTILVTVLKDKRLVNNNSKGNNDSNSNSDLIKNISKNLNQINNCSTTNQRTEIPNSSSTLNDVIAYFEKEKMISLGESAFIKKRYQNNDEMLLSFWEVYKKSDGELVDFIESLKTFITKHHEKNTNSPEPVGSKTPISIANTKKDLINLFRSKEKKESEVIKKKQKQIITLLLNEELMESSAESFLNMKIEEKDQMISSVFEVFSVTRDHRDFIESLNLIKEIMYNKDSNSNDPLAQCMNILNTILQKSNFNNNQKELLRELLLQSNQTILSTVELYETEKDIDEALETLAMSLKKRNKLNR